MSDDRMSQNQVEGLLRAMKAGGTGSGAADFGRAVEAAGSEGDAGFGGATIAGPGSEPVVPYDFQRPSPIGPLQLQTLRSRHAAVATDFAAAAAALLRMKVDVKLAGLQQITYSEFLKGRDAPRCFHLLAAEPLEGNWLLEIDPPLAYAVVDRMLGGDADPGPLAPRPMTDIEIRLVGRMVTVLLGQLELAWQRVEPLRLAVERVESHPLLVQLASPGDVVVVVTMEVALGTCRGTLSLCIPAASLKQLADEAGSSGGTGSAAPQATAAVRKTVSNQLDVASVELVVTLASSKIRTQELLDLAVGDVITTEQDVAAPLELAVQGVPKFAVRPGAFRGKKAICVQGLIEAQDAWGAGVER